jgi:hypothetical protein
MMRIALSSLLLALASLSGCASSLPAARVDDRLSRLVGKPVESALAAYGAPSCGSVEGNRRYMTWLYRWEPNAGTVAPPAREQPLQAQHALVSYGRGAGGWVGAANAFDCRMSLEVDDRGRVQDYFYDGEACARRL